MHSETHESYNCANRFQAKHLPVKKKSLKFNDAAVRRADAHPIQMSAFSSAPSPGYSFEYL